MCHIFSSISMTRTDTSVWFVVSMNIVTFLYVEYHSVCYTTGTQWLTSKSQLPTPLRQLERLTIFHDTTAHRGNSCSRRQTRVFMCLIMSSQSAASVETISSSQPAWMTLLLFPTSFMKKNPSKDQVSKVDTRPWSTSRRAVTHKQNLRSSLECTVSDVMIPPASGSLI